MPFSPRPIGCRPIVVRPPRVRPPMELDGLADIAALVSVLGGNASVPAFYDVRAGVTATTTVSQWDDARGVTGFGPSLVQATANSRPTFDPFAQTLTFDATDDTLATGASALFALAVPITLVLIGAIQQTAAIAHCMAIADAAGLSRFMSIRGTATASGVLAMQVQASGSAGSVVVSTTRRCAIAGTDGTTGMTFDVPNVARVSSAAGASPASGNNILTLGNSFSGNVSPASLVVRAALVLNRQATAADVATLLAWAQANHGAVAA